MSYASCLNYWKCAHNFVLMAACYISTIEIVSCLLTCIFLHIFFIVVLCGVFSHSFYLYIYDIHPTMNSVVFQLLRLFFFRFSWWENLFSHSKNKTTKKYGRGKIILPHPMLNKTKTKSKR